MDELNYNENGYPIYQRNLGQNSDYWRNVVGQCVFWYKNKQIHNKKKIRLSDKKIAEYFHSKFKENVLKSVFSLESTTNLSTEQMPEFIAECFIFLSSEIDVYEYGEV